MDFALFAPFHVPMIDSSLYILNPNHVLSWNFISIIAPLLFVVL